MKAVFLDFATMGPGLDLGPLEQAVSELRLFDHTADRETAARIADAEIVFTNKMRLDSALLDTAGKLRFIGLTATGTDNIDLAAAKRHGIAVSNIRAYCTASVVEHVFGSLLMLSHSLLEYRDDVRRGAWQNAVQFCLLTHPVVELSSMTLGVVGYGELGRGVAERGRDFGMRVLVSARRDAKTVPEGRVPFEEMLENSDVVSLHCPLTPETRNLIGARELERMKPGAILINTARGGLVDAAALVAALRAGKLRGAAIDVLAREPPVDGDPLLDYRGDNLIVTPHIAWATTTARQNAIDELAANTRAFIAGERRNRVD